MVKSLGEIIDLVKELNALLKGEHMAINAYDRYIYEINDDKVKTELEKFQKDHKRHAEEISQHIEAIGGKPNNGTGIAGVMASIKNSVTHVGINNVVDILKEAYDGEDKGTAMAEELVKGDLDKNSMNLVSRILKEDHEHLRRMALIIGRIENGE